MIAEYLKYIKKFFSTISIEFRKKIILEIHAADHCNLNCRGCSHYSPVAEPHFCNLDTLQKSMEKLSKFSDCFSYINILGGEPLLFHDICKMMRIVRQYMLNNKIRLMTNGLLLTTPHRLPVDFWETCRKNNIMLSITPYPINIDYDEIK